jgi:ribonuclease J
MVATQDELVFVPLGGLDEIGMNAALYGFGPPHRRKWILVDLGLAFAGPSLPGIDLVMPDLTFAERIRNDLLGLVITHAHEDHVGAIADLWSRLGCPIFATPFAAGLLQTRRLSEPGAPQVDMRIVAQGSRFDLGPFNIEFVPVSHSIPESNALAIRTPAGTVLHTGDWKRDERPVIGLPTDEKRLREIGDEGVLALVCDSTNIMREGESPSETDVGAALAEIISQAKGRVVVTTFASNVARLRSVAAAAIAAGRMVIVAGRAIDRTIQVARELGYFEGFPPFLTSMAYSNFPRDKVVVLATGSQGEPRAAMARIAEGEHPDLKLAKDDLVIFSSRPIPGNERGINAILNGLALQGVHVLTDRDGLVHASGHPRRGEVAQMYDWIRPRIAVPAHGEPMHLAAHADFARARGVEHVFTLRNGAMLSFGPGQPGIVEEVPHGRLLKDGDVLLDPDDQAVNDRVKLAFAGVISIGIALTSKGQLAGDPDVVFTGLPARSRDGKPMDEVVDDAIFGVLDSLPRGMRRDADSVATAVERGVRNTLRNAWGKRPVVHVLVMEV